MINSVATKVKAAFGSSRKEFKVSFSFFFTYL